MTEMIAARRASVTFAGSHAHGHGPLRARRKALELHRCKSGLGCKKGHGEKREEKQVSMHGPLRCSIHSRLRRSYQVVRRRPLTLIKARRSRSFKRSENHFVALIDFSTASLGQQ